MKRREFLGALAGLLAFGRWAPVAGPGAVAQGGADLLPDVGARYDLGAQSTRVRSLYGEFDTVFDAELKYAYESRRSVL